MKDLIIDIQSCRITVPDSFINYNPTQQEEFIKTAMINKGVKAETLIENWHETKGDNSGSVSNQKIKVYLSTGDLDKLFEGKGHNWTFPTNKGEDIDIELYYNEFDEDDKLESEGKS